MAHGDYRSASARVIISAVRCIVQRLAQLLSQFLPASQEPVVFCYVSDSAVVAVMRCKAACMPGHMQVSTHRGT